MANIKFSDFTVGNTEGDIDFVVGYKGASNIQISPTNLLASALGSYLPLAGGTMTGSIILNDDVRLRAGTGSDFSFFHNGSNSKINNNTGNIEIENFQDDGDIIFKSDDGSGGTTEYFRVDGGLNKTVVNKSFIFEDNTQVQFGSSADLVLLHNATDSFIINETGDFYISNQADNKDIVFTNDNGSGGTATYFFLDGSAVNGSSVLGATVFPDKSKIYVGTGGDLEIFHNGSQTYIENYTGTFNITQHANDGDMIFKCDDGSGGATEYFRLDGSDADGTYTYTRRPDGGVSTFGNDKDLRIWHDPSTNFSYIRNYTNDLSIENTQEDGDIIFKSDNGSGGLDTYFSVVGAGNRVQYNKNLRLIDNAIASFGSDDDLKIKHDGTDSYIQNLTGNLEITNNSNDKDIIFRSDDGSGGLAEYFKVDGSETNTLFSKPARFIDSIAAQFGTDSDLIIKHDNTDAKIDNFTGDLYIRNFSDDKDIIFQSDDGAGGTTTYFFLDGSIVENRFSKATRHSDNIIAKFGDANDLNIYSNGSNSYIENFNNDFIISNTADDKDMRFFCDDGSGGVAEYFRLDGGAVKTIVSKNFAFLDDVKAEFGDSGDLQIYHDGGNSHIKDTGTGFLIIEADAALVLQNAGGEPYLQAISNGAVQLYFDNSKKLETTSTGVKISGVSEYADNTAAIAGGLTTGDVYRTGDLLKIVH